MKYGFMPKVMWAAFAKSFKKAICEVMPQENAMVVIKKAHAECKRILATATTSIRRNKL